MKIKERFIEDLSANDLNKLNAELTLSIPESEFNAFYCFFDMIATSDYSEEAVKQFKQRFCGIYYSAEDFVQQDLFECYNLPDFLELAINYDRLVTMLETGGAYLFYDVPEGCAVFTGA